MGQGTESCGGYEHDYDPYEELIIKGEWTQKDGGGISVSVMEDSQIRNSIRLCLKNSANASFSCDSDKWDGWVELFENELERRRSNPSLSIARKPSPQKPRKKKKAPKGLVIHNVTRQEMKCSCGTVYSAKTADLKRGWGLSCSKRCASIRREYGRPAAVSNLIETI